MTGANVGTGGENPDGPVAETGAAASPDVPDTTPRRFRWRSARSRGACRRSGRGRVPRIGQGELWLVTAAGVFGMVKFDWLF